MCELTSVRTTAWRLLGTMIAVLALATFGRAAAEEMVGSDLVSPYPFVVTASTGAPEVAVVTDYLAPYPTTPEEAVMPGRVIPEGSAGLLPEAEALEHEAWVRAIWESP